MKLAKGILHLLLASGALAIIFNFVELMGKARAATWFPWSAISVCLLFLLCTIYLHLAFLRVAIPPRSGTEGSVPFPPKVRQRIIGLLEGANAISGNWISHVGYIYILISFIWDGLRHRFDADWAMEIYLPYLFIGLGVALRCRSAIQSK